MLQISHEDRQYKFPVTCRLRLLLWPPKTVVNTRARAHTHTHWLKSLINQNSVRRNLLTKRNSILFTKSWMKCKRETSESVGLYIKNWKKTKVFNIEDTVGRDPPVSQTREHYASTTTAFTSEDTGGRDALSRKRVNTMRLQRQPSLARILGVVTPYLANAWTPVSYTHLDVYKRQPVRDKSFTLRMHYILHRASAHWWTKASPRQFSTNFPPEKSRLVHCHGWIQRERTYKNFIKI